MKAKFITIFIIFCLASALPLFAADQGKYKDILGDWKMKFSFGGGGQMTSTLSISLKDDGSLAVKISPDMGESKITDLKFENNKLSFTRTSTFRDNEFSTDYEATLANNTLKGIMSSDMGDNDFTAAKFVPKSDAVGIWLIQGQPADTKLSILEDPNGKLIGKWADYKISDAQFKNGKLSFKRTSKTNPKDQVAYEATVKGDELTGKLINAKRYGSDLIGKWILTTKDEERGERKSNFVVDKDLTATYDMWMSEVPVSDLKIDGQNITFTINMEFGERSFSLDFKGKLTAPGKLQGQMVSDRGTLEVTGEKVIPGAQKPAAAEKPAAPAVKKVETPKPADVNKPAAKPQ